MIQPSLILDRKAELGTGVQPFFEFERIFQYLKENTLTLSEKYFIIEHQKGVMYGRGVNSHRATRHKAV